MGTGDRRGYVSETIYKYVNNEVGQYWKDIGEILGYINNDGNKYFAKAIYRYITGSFNENFKNILNGLI
jgi:hypothetical protein